MVYPPVDIDFYTPSDQPRADTNTWSSPPSLPYKKIDLAIEAFNLTGRPLLIVGSGEDEARLKGMAKGNIRFQSNVSGEGLRDLYRTCKALVYPGEEDFGMIPVEAMACGAPVIAYGRGGALETIIPLRDEFIDNPTGMFFDRQRIDSLTGAIEKFEKAESAFHAQAMRKNAERFSKEIFVEKMATVINDFLPAL